MLRNSVFTALTLALLAAAPSARAQGADRQKFGIGIAANANFDDVTGGTIGALPIEIYFPLRLSPQLRIEPSLGISTGNFDGGGDFSDVRLGVGVFAVKRLSAPVDLYYGGRLKLAFYSQEIAGGDESETNFFLAGAVGGEYFVVPAFSLGLEANLGYYALGDLSDDQSGFFTNGLFFLRMYF